MHNAYTGVRGHQFKVEFSHQAINFGPLRPGIDIVEALSIFGKAEVVLDISFGCAFSSMPVKDLTQFDALPRWLTGSGTVVVGSPALLPLRLDVVSNDFHFPIRMVTPESSSYFCLLVNNASLDEARGCAFVDFSFREA